MDALTKKQKKVLGQALRLLFDKSEDNYDTSVTILELAQKFETRNADEIKNDLHFITSNPY